MNLEGESFFRRWVTASFVEATGHLHHLLLGEYATDERWLWQANMADSFGGEWVAAYSLVATDQMESAIGKPRLVQIAAALFPAITLTVDIFAEYHHPGGLGLQVLPRICISACVDGEQELTLVEEFLKLSKEHLPFNSRGVTVKVFPAENCCDGIKNPPDIAKAYAQVAQAARVVALRESGSTIVTERVKLIFDFDRNVDPAHMEEVFEIMGLLFLSVSMAKN